MKNIVQHHVPVALPCYDFTPVLNNNVAKTTKQWYYKYYLIIIYFIIAK